MSRFARAFAHVEGDKLMHLDERTLTSMESDSVGKLDALGVAGCSLAATGLCVDCRSSLRAALAAYVWSFCICLQ